jgi:hypothetical protein
MSCLGVHFALSDEKVERLLSARSNGEVLSIVKEEIETDWDEEWLQEAGKAWDAIHRCLTDGSLVVKDASPLSKCILGGRQLYQADNYVISFLNPAETCEVFHAIKDINREWLEGKYFALEDTTSDYSVDEADFEISWSYFEELKHFFQKTAQHGRAVIFAADQ